MRGLERAYDRLINTMGWIAGSILILLMLATVLKVALRLFFGHGLLGIDQISGIMMVWMTFLGAAWVLREGGHVAVDILTSNLTGNTARVAALIAAVTGTIVCLAVAWFGFQAVITSLRRGVVVAAELEIPRAVNLIPIPFGALLMGLEFMRQAINICRGEIPVTAGAH
ncbi:TRAP transporter small permease [Paracoccus sulfuroxidans]|uniref:TRAP transporter small permease protein n=1 Tax=Paracoccus sulfuroxidans TaxID=384678 RepID=A0A562NGC3_9RHOB|nr:TRAP transporter small permease subunit [Paracoccus sulfuroxidans]TWI31242.1 TRAP-type C4-dicarboxylate transport system permease small subunit [Paracoccus sulfuroxidans]